MTIYGKAGSSLRLVERRCVAAAGYLPVDGRLWASIDRRFVGVSPGGVQHIGGFLTSTGKGDATGCRWRWRRRGAGHQGTAAVAQLDAGRSSRTVRVQAAVTALREAVARLGRGAVDTGDGATYIGRLGQRGLAAQATSADRPVVRVVLFVDGRILDRRIVRPE